MRRGHSLPLYSELCFSEYFKRNILINIFVLFIRYILCCFHTNRPINNTLINYPTASYRVPFVMPDLTTKYAESIIDLPSMSEKPKVPKPMRHKR
jgi:hypothetical protein